MCAETHDQIIRPTRCKGNSGAHVRRIAFGGLATVGFSIVALAGSWIMATSATAQLAEVPMFEDMVSKGQLPPMAERLPAEPYQVEFESRGREIGQYGGDMGILIGRQKDIRLMTMYGYARLVGFDEDLNLKPDILKDIKVTDGRIFTLRLREGHKWSDGHPFTSEDFRYYWEDVASNEKLKRGGLPPALSPGGHAPRFIMIDELTVRYIWPVPNPLFMAELAGARPLEIAMPAHYMQQFHADYQDADRIAEMVEEASVKDWSSLHTRMARSYRPENPDLPTLQPWRPVTTPPAERFIFERNPYYHRVDTNGQQLPYIDRFILSTGSSSLIPAKTGTGEAQLQSRYLRFDDYTFLKAGEKQHNYEVRLWETGKGSQMAIIPNLNVKDEGWRKLFQDKRFRQALSLGINRNEINEAIYYGLARESGNTMLPQSPLYEERFAKAWTDFDIERANAMLDELGLDEKDFDGIRRLPDGRRAEIIIALAGESTEESDVIELITDGWRRIGIKLFQRASQRDVFRRRIFSGDTMMSVWAGLDNGVATPDFTPEELAPTKQDQYQWPMWGLHNESRGESGEPPALEAAIELKALYDQWLVASTSAERKDIWTRMLEINAEEVFTIGIVNGGAQPVVVSNTLNNVPEKGLHTYSPGAYFGMYKPDTFWFDQSQIDPS